MARQRDQDAGFAQGNSRGGASGDGSAGGARGRGARMAGATKTVFQPTVRAPPLGVHSRMRSAPNRAHAELKAGRSGLALVNKKPATAAPGTGGGLTANDASSEQPADSAHEPGADAAAGPANPWGVPSMRWDEMDDNSNYHMGGLDDYDEGFTSDGARARPGPRLLEKRQPVVQAEEAPAIHTNNEDKSTAPVVGQ
ncbi:hypothetical protein IWQ56_001489 [Coemansia nantahalensis]|nr:hypothetical protein IWQ56_001489 [Coemansia nantahalensis]